MNVSSCRFQADSPQKPAQEEATAAVTALLAAARIWVADEPARAVTLWVEAARPTT
jgi:hypothetical protein